MDKPQLLSENEDGRTIWDYQQRLYREVFPSMPGCFDFADLAREGLSSGDLLRQLLEEGAFQVELSEDTATAPPLSYWHQENQNQKRVWGHHPLALGFPLLLFSAGESIRVAPLYLWKLSLESSPDQAGNWKLGHGAEQDVYVNPWLMDWLSRRDAIDCCQSLRALLDQERLSMEHLRGALQQLSEAMGWPDIPAAPSLESFPGIDQLDEQVSRGAVLWSGVVAPFPAPVPVLKHPPSTLLPTEEIREPAGHAFGLCALDPYQATAYQAARHNRLTVIDGPSGSGKTHLLLHLLSNALSNGKKCLVVAPSLGSLRDINKRLGAWKLAPFSFLATDAKRDGTLLLDMLRAIADTPVPVTDYDEEAYRQLLSKWQREKQKLDDGFQALRRPVFGAATWTETVGLFLESNAIEGKELLSTQLQIQDFRFSYEEFEELKEAVLQSRPLYQRINTLRHPLQELHADIFLNFDREDAEAFVREQLTVFTEKFVRLQKTYIKKVNYYADQLTRHYEDWYRSMEEERRRLQEEIADRIQEYGRDFALTSLTSLRLYGSFIGRFKRMLEAKESIFSAYRALADRFQESSYIEFAFAPAGEGRDLPRMRESLDAFGKELREWRESLPGLLQEHLDRLSNKTVHPPIRFQGHILELEDRLDLLLAELNRSGLYAKPLENRMLTIPRRRKYLESVMEQIENTRLYLRDFEAFYDWHRYWLELPGHVQKVVRALIKVKPADWVAAFKSWYLYHCLSQAYHPGLPVKGPSLRQFVFNNDQLLPLLPPQIIHHWGTHREGLLREWRRHDRKQYQQFFSRKTTDVGGDALLQKLFDAETNRLTDLLPVLLLTPQVAETVISGEEQFDLVLIEEAHTLSLPQVQAALKAGKQKVLFGNSAWERLGPEDSLLKAALREAGTRYRLPVVHQWSPGNVLASMNASFLSHDAIGGFSAHFEQVDGRYDERSRQNQEEAQQIIRLLNEIEKTPHRTYPSIAIVSLTVGQRDLIASYLHDIKQRQLPGAEVIRQLERNGLGVFHIGELTGQRPEVLLFSGTYGYTDWQGRLTDHLQQLNRSEGVALLDLLMSRPTKSIFVVNSVPAADLDHFAEDFTKVGTFLLANYLKYVYSLHIADADEQHRIIQRLAAHFQSDDPVDQSSPFTMEVARALQSHIPAARIHVGRTDAHFHLPLVVDPAVVSAPAAVVLPDGFLSRAPVTDYRWEFQQWELFREHDYHLVPTWSVNWWKNAPLEAKRLADKINEKTEATGPSR